MKTCLSCAAKAMKKYAVLPAFSSVVLLGVGCMSYKPLEVNPQILLHESSENFKATTSDPSREVSASLDFEALRELALAGNPDIRVARADAKIAAWLEEFAGRPDDSEFDFSVLRILESADNPLVWTAGLSFAVPLSGRLRAARELAHAETVEAIQGLAVEENALIAEVTAAHLDYSRAALLYNAAMEIRELDGALPISDGELGELVEQMEEAREEIRELLGLLPEDEFEIVPSIHVDQITLPDSVDDLVTQSLILNHQQASFEVSDMAVRLAVREQYPDLNLGPLFELDEGTGKLGIGVSFPIPLFGHGRAAIREAMAEREVNYREFGAGVIDAYRVYKELVDASEELAEQGEIPTVSSLYQTHRGDTYTVYTDHVEAAYELAIHMKTRGTLLSFPVTKLHDPKKLIEE